MKGQRGFGEDDTSLGARHQDSECVPGGTAHTAGSRLRQHRHDSSTYRQHGESVSWSESQCNGPPRPYLFATAEATRLKSAVSTLPTGKIGMVSKSMVSPTPVMLNRRF